jgi:hypothetical protein
MRFYVLQEIKIMKRIQYTLLMFGASANLMLAEGIEKIERNFHVTEQITKDGAKVTLTITEEQAVSNHQYKLQFASPDGLNQTLSLRNGVPIEDAARFVDLNGDGYLDIMIPGGYDYAKRTWYKTLIYKPDLKEYRWLDLKS